MANVKRRIIFVGVVVALTALGGCSFHSPLTPPRGWSGTPQFMGDQGFRSPDGTQQILITHPTEPRPTSFPKSLERWTPLTICGDHAAMLMQGRAILNGKDVQMDEVDTNWDGTRVTAMYMRPYGTPAAPEAERAIRSLCSSY